MTDPGGSLLARATLLSLAPGLPSRRLLLSLVEGARAAPDAEEAALRPRDSLGRPGGLLELPALPVLLVPDLHARPAFLAAVLAWRPPRPPAAPGSRSAPGSRGAPPRLIELLAAGQALLVCLGDAFHSEAGGAARRWNLAWREYLGGWETQAAMDREMALSLSCVELILRLKRAYPAGFHYLKGNHDNILSEDAHGDHGFHKFADEGAMVASWFEARYGRDLRESYRLLERSLPVLARRLDGQGSFVASHAEPAFALGPAEAIESRSRPGVVEALTWTANDAAEPGSVEDSLVALLGHGLGGPRWFGGHRPVEGRFALRAGGRYVQFHAPGERRFLWLRPGIAPDPGRDLHEA